VSACILPGWDGRSKGIQLPEGEPVDLWVSDDGRLVDYPVTGAESLPGRFVLPGLVDAHEHPAIGEGSEGPVGRNTEEIAEVLAGWASSGVTHLRDTGSPAGVTLGIERRPGLPSVVAAGRFLAPAGRYFPALLPEPVPPELLTELALGEVARGAGWVKVIGDFPAVDGQPGGEVAQCYPLEVLAGMVEAVHAVGGRVAVHCTMPLVADLVRAGVDSIEHGVAMDETALELMAATGAAWTPTLSAVLSMQNEGVPDDLRRMVADFRDRLQTMPPLAARLGVTVLVGTDTVGTLVDEIAALAAHGLGPAKAIASASTTALDFLGFPRRAGDGSEPGPATLVTYEADPRDDLTVLSAPSAVVVAGTRVR
jgi:imidazolonepropionase-like amidohydrolase